MVFSQNKLIKILLFCETKMAAVTSYENTIPSCTFIIFMILTFHPTAGHPCSRSVFFQFFTGWSVVSLYRYFGISSSTLLYNCGKVCHLIFVKLLIFYSLKTILHKHYFNNSFSKTFPFVIHSTFYFATFRTVLQPVFKLLLI